MPKNNNEEIIIENSGTSKELAAVFGGKCYQKGVLETLVGVAIIGLAAAGIYKIHNKKIENVEKGINDFIK